MMKKLMIIAVSLSIIAGSNIYAKDNKTEIKKRGIEIIDFIRTDKTPDEIKHQYLILTQVLLMKQKELEFASAQLKSFKIILDSCDDEQPQAFSMCNQSFEHLKKTIEGVL